MKGDIGEKEEKVEKHIILKNRRRCGGLPSLLGRGRFIIKGCNAIRRKLRLSDLKGRVFLPHGGGMGVGKKSFLEGQGDGSNGTTFRRKDSVP